VCVISKECCDHHGGALDHGPTTQRAKEHQSTILRFGNREGSSPQRLRLINGTAAECWRSRDYASRNITNVTTLFSRSSSKLAPAALVSSCSPERAQKCSAVVYLLEVTSGLFSTHEFRSITRVL